MSVELLTQFLMWCSIINVGLLLFWTAVLSAAPDFAYKLQRRWFPLSQESWSTVMYGFLGLFKIFVIIFNIVPYIAMLIVT